MTLLTVQGADVETQLANGTSYKGVFYTSTPFESHEYKLAIRASRPIVSSYVNMKENISYQTFYESTLPLCSPVMVKLTPRVMLKLDQRLYLTRRRFVMLKCRN